MTKLRFLAAVLISPLAVPVILGVISIVASWPIYYDSSFVAFIWILSLATITSYVGLFAIGLPLIYVLRRAGYLNFLALAVTGALAGIAAIYFSFIFFGFSFGFSSSIKVLLNGAVWGLAVACLFGLIAAVPFNRQAYLSKNN